MTETTEIDSVVTPNRSANHEEPSVASSTGGKPASGSSKPRLGLLLSRAFRLQCPECGRGGIFKHWLSIRDECPNCAYKFEREAGYFLGAQHVSLAAAMLVPILLLAALYIWTDLSVMALEIILVPPALFVPLLMYPFACTIWMAFDLYLTPTNQR